MGFQLKWAVHRDALWPSVKVKAIIASLCIQWGMLMVVGLRLENVSVPPSGILGGSVTLDCDYFLESDKLLSLKWYRDGHEFFRYFPGTRGTESPISTFPVPGVYVDLGESLKVQLGRVRIRLKNLDFNSGGTYRCEISAEAPTFRTLHGDGNLSIIALPEKPRVTLSGFPTTVQYADRVKGNCSFANSYPAAQLTLYLNNAKINKSTDSDIDLIPYEPIKVGQRFTSVLGLWIRIAPKHIQSGTGIAQIRCEARLIDKTWATLNINITHQNYQQPFYTAGQNRYSSGNGVGCYSLGLAGTITILSTFSSFRGFIIS